ncbi:MAG: methyltransferase domain-containing protein [Candidatus Aenigmarchaeota archaeon]|nr:methyltransferase domain-containing protein [Candidatus Aenigmarchaeota archaeon]MCX8190666.1 methyltransferase domain-containing protein [Candidatus Aenigmarchaeota archaeon]MDW8159916.1 methyltransferase domain-containing protein [Candidatus Aenigmarchaeota archaeon]
MKRFVGSKKRILNVGCGSDTYGTHFVDLYPTRKEVVKCNVDEERLPFRSNFFDEVYSKNLLEHLRNPSFCLKEMKRVLKKGGELVIITDNASYWVWAVGKTHHGGYSSGFSEDKHYSIYLPEHLVNHLKKLGFRRIRFDFILDSDNFLIKMIDKFLSLTPLRRLGFKRFKIVALK